MQQLMCPEGKGPRHLDVYVYVCGTTCTCTRVRVCVKPAEGCTVYGFTGLCECVRVTTVKRKYRTGDEIS